MTTLTLTVIGHGAWEEYRPGLVPVEAPRGAIFARRTDDQVDWYDYVNDRDNFAPENVKFAAIIRDYAGGYVVGAAVYDATMLFPAGQIVGEITDYTGTDPQTDLGNKLYDPATGTFSDYTPPPVRTAFEQQVLTALDGITSRLEALEKKRK